MNDTKQQAISARNFQNRGGFIPPYQARQLIKMMDKYADCYVQGDAAVTTQEIEDMLAKRGVGPVLSIAIPLPGRVWVYRDGKWLARLRIPGS